MVFSHKDGYDKYTAWKRVWTSNGKTEPSPKAFMADQQLPYWVRGDTVAPVHCKAKSMSMGTVELCGKSSLGLFLGLLKQKPLLTQYSLRKKVMSHTAIWLMFIHPSFDGHLGCLIV